MATRAGGTRKPRHVEHSAAYAALQRTCGGMVPQHVLLQCTLEAGGWIKELEYSDGSRLVYGKLPDGSVGWRAFIT